MNLTTTRLLGPAAFATGLAVLVWVAFGALGTNPIALVVTLVMAGFFVMGALELRRFALGSRALKAAVATLPTDAAGYDAWLAALPAPLPVAVRQRVDHGGRGPLPGPALAPTLTGLLVLLGMLGTFIGMVATLHGTGLAVEQATELDALRDALAAPVKGLGLAFGTSVAGVATSAMLGLMTALARRERAEAAQWLDRAIGTTLQPFSAAHRASLQHDATLRALQRQADTVPAMVTTMVDTVVTPLMDRLQTMMGALQQQHDQAQQRLLDGEHRLAQRLLDGQAQFHARTEAGYGALAAAVERTLKESLAEGSRQVHAQVQPLLEATMGSLSREASTLHGHLSDTVQRQLVEVTGRLAEHGRAQAALWQQALEAHRLQQHGHAEHLQGALGAFTTAFDERSTALVQGLMSRLGDLQAGQQTAWAEQDAGRLDAWRDTVATMTTALHDSTASIAGDLRGTVGTMTTELRDAVAAMTTDLRDSTRAMTVDLRDSTRAMTVDLGDRASAMATGLRDASTAAADAQRDSTARMTAEFRDTVAAMTTGLHDTVAAMTGGLRDTVATMTTELREAWQAAGDHTAARQQQICDTLAQVARSITDTTQTQARATVEEIGRLLLSAAEAPRAAAEVIGELRERLTEAMARDDASLRERERLMETLGTLLSAVNQASTDQRAAIEALVDTAGTLLQQAGERLQAQADHQGAALAEAATRTQASAVEMATLGEAFGSAVQRFGDSNESLMAHLQRIEAALSQTLARSDEQLNYYVAQAREVIDLSLSSQKQVIEDLQALARREAA